ncbi:MAG: hypothetical protein ACTSR8_17400 [Promethearchaeota archaeon]
MEIYTIKDDKIELSKRLTHENIAFISDGTRGYVWKGKNARDLDEQTAKKIDILIKNKFDDVKFELLSGLDIKKEDNPKIIQIKQEIIKRLPGKVSTKIKEKQQGILNGIKQKLEEFKNYELSMNWRKKLSNLTNLWKLSLFNIIIIGFCMIFIFNQSLFHVSIGDYFLLLAFFLLLIIFMINLIFIIFPMKFPIKVLSISTEPKAALPAKPVVPKSSNLTKKPIVRQLKIGPLTTSPRKAPKKNDKMQSDGTEYLTEEDMALGIPAIPEAPKKMKKISIDSPGLSTIILDKIKELESKDTEVVLVNCDRCKSVIPVPVPKKAVLNSKLPVVPISFIHKNLKGKDEHCVTIHIDHDFDIRRQRISDAVISK